MMSEIARAIKSLDALKRDLQRMEEDEAYSIFDDWEIGEVAYTVSRAIDLLEKESQKGESEMKVTFTTPSIGVVVEDSDGNIALNAQYENVDVFVDFTKLVTAGMSLSRLIAQQLEQAAAKS